VHIDLDFFNNRYNWNSDWHEQPDRHDPSTERILDRIGDVVEALLPLRSRIVDIAIGISPGFFPAEFWQPAYDELIRELAGGRKYVDNPSP
jgi:hypothetical protein